jgi:superfamily II DNA or RNA helicase
MYKDIPIEIMEKLNLPAIDKGIDIVCIDKNDKIYGVQCKYRADRDTIIPWGELSTFPALAFTCDIDIGVFITNCFDVCVDLKSKNKIVIIYGSFWDTIDDNFIEILKAYLKNIDLSFSKNELPHQTLITNETEQYLTKNDRGMLIMACGTGKTLQSYFICGKMNYKNIIISVPSLLLLSQFYLEWSKQKHLNAILVGSDFHNDENENPPGLILTTDFSIIDNWLIDNWNKEKYIFTTYQSADLVKCALIGLDMTFDICIYDEAHLTTGAAGSQFTTLLDDKFLVEKRLFFTATPKIYSGERDDVYSMTDVDTYGDVISEISFRDAIEKKLLTDYQIITPMITDMQINDYIKKNKYVLLNKIEYTSNMLGIAILLINSMTKNVKTMRKILTYHSRVQSNKSTDITVKKFKKLLEYLKTIMKLDFDIYSMDGKMSIGQRNKILKEFEISKKQSIICSAQVLNVGINVPCVDTVVFVSPKDSVIDIVQCMGRSLRLYKNKTIANIVIPVILDNNNLGSKSAFDQIWKIVRAIGTSDHLLVDEFKQRALTKNNKTGRIVCEYLDDDIGIQIDIDAWITNISSECWKRLDGFDVIYTKIKAWVEDNDKIPSANSKNLTEVQYGNWCSRQRDDYKNNLLSDDKIELLEKINGWVWNKEDTFLIRYTEVKGWAEFNKKIPCMISLDKDEKKYGTWCSNLRRRKSELSNDKITLLEKIYGWFWDKNELFLGSYNEVKTWIELNKKIPSSSSIDLIEKKYNIWCNTQRKLKREGKLNNDKIILLEKIDDWFWDKFDEQFCNIHGEIAQWVKTHNKFPSAVSKDPIEKKLYRWYHHRREDKKKNQLSSEKISLLEQIDGWTWQKEDPFIQMQLDFEKWFEINKKIPSIISKDNIEKKFAVWFKNCRKNYKKNKLSDDKIRSLEQTKGWYWERDDLFNETYFEVKEWAIKNNKLPNKRSNDKIEKKYGYWCNNLRQDSRSNKLSDEKRKLLEQIVDWYWIES